MAYDPQRDRRRPKPSGDEPAPIETILDAEESTISTVPSDRAPSSPVLDDPPPDPSVTPQPADPWSDKLLFGVSISTIVGTVAAALVFRWVWIRRRRSRSSGQGE
jgi:hypothetical protein